MLDFINELAELGIACRIESGINKSKLAIKLSFYRNDNLIKVAIKEVISHDDQALGQWIGECIDDIKSKI